MKNPLTRAAREISEPLVGSTMCELGDKRNKNGTYKKYFELKNWTHVSIDWKGKDGVLKLDLRERISLAELGVTKPFDVVTNFGCTEHIDPQGEVWQNILDWLAIGGLFISSTPAPGDWLYHAKWYPSEAWYMKFAELNKLEVERCYTTSGRRLVCFRAKKIKDVEIVYVPHNLFFINKAPRRQ